MVILLRGKKSTIKNIINIEQKSLFNVLENVNLFRKINYKNGIKLINNINQNYVNMASSFWRPWKHQEQETSTTEETENTLEI